jgi:hypothetical protein
MIKGFDYGLNHSENPYLGMVLECSQQPNKCLHGVFNSDNLNQNFRKLD